MAFNFNDVIINKPVSGGTTNFSYLSSKGIKDGVIENSNYKSSVVNSLLYKITDSINYIQKNGFTSFIISKPYTINSTVVVSYYDNGILRNTLLRCINVDNSGFCDVLPNDNYIVDDNGNIIFSNNIWNYNYWSELSKENLNEYTITCKEFYMNYSTSIKSRSNNQIKSIELFDYSNISDVKNSIFTILVERINKIFFTCSISGNSNGVKLEIKNVKNIDNINLYNNSIWVEQSIFSNIALDGLFLSVDENNKKVYLHYLAKDVSNSNQKSSFDVTIKMDKGSFGLSLAQIDNLNIIDNNDFVIIPLIRNASNVFSRKTLNIFDYSYLLNTKEIFKNGLYYISGEDTLDSWLYPIFRKSNNNVSTIYNLLGRYKQYSNNNDRYIESKFANIIGESASNVLSKDGLSGPFQLTDKKEYLKWASTEVILNYTMYDCYMDTAGSYGNDYTYNGGINWIYKSIDPTSGSTTDWLRYNTPLNKDNFFNSDPNDEERLTTASIKTFPYIKVW